LQIACQTALQSKLLKQNMIRPPLKWLSREDMNIVTVLKLFRKRKVLEICIIS